MAAEMSNLYYQKPLVITYSGGKDSDVLVNLAYECLDKDQFEVINNHTTVDAPETVYHIRDVFCRLGEEGIKTTVMYPDKTMWELIVSNGVPPTRIARYCCKKLKESRIPNRFIATGVRSEESSGRKNRDLFSIRAEKKSDAKFYSLKHAEEVFQESEDARQELGLEPNDKDSFDCQLIENAKLNNDLIVMPLYEWTFSDIWEYIKNRKLTVNKLYLMGYERVGCVGCPMKNYAERMKDFILFPKYKAAYINAFQRMIDRKKSLGKPCTWADGEACFDWWVDDPNIPGQMSIYDYMKGKGYDKS